MGILYGEYEILEELPSWTTGTVYRARHRSSGEMGAIKIMDMFEIEREDRDTFYATASKATKLKHKNIARIIDVCKRIDSSMIQKDDERETAYIVQEFVQGASLDKVIKEQQDPFMPQLAFYIIEQVIEGLKTGYSKKIPHRNLTMSNIILRRDGQVKLVDYGIGRLFSNGTVFYMSPEDVAGDEISEKAEIFTVGIILFEMLMGQRPFEGDNFGQLMNRIMGGEYNKERMQQIPEFMRTIVEKCLQKNPKKRYATFKALLKDVKQCQKSPKLFAFNRPLVEGIPAEAAAEVSEEQIPAEQVEEELAEKEPSKEEPAQEDIQEETPEEEQAPVQEVEEEPAEEALPEEETEKEKPPEEETVEDKAQEETPEEQEDETVAAEQGEADREVPVPEMPASAADTEAPISEDEEDMSGMITEELEEMEHKDFPSTGAVYEEETEKQEEEKKEEQASFSFEDPFLQMIADVPMFKGLDEKSIRRFSGVLKTRSFTDGTEIITQGQPGDNLYVILDGTVAVIQQDSDDNELELTELGEGDCFGEMSLLTGEPCSATIRSKGPATLLSLFKDDFQLMLAEYPSISAHFNKILITRLRNTNLKFENEIEEGVSGKLSTISLSDLIQTIFIGQKTGTLLLSYRKTKAMVFFREGKIRSVTAGKFESERAFYSVLEWTDGTFRFAQGDDEEIEENIETDTNGLLMEGMRRLDESNKLVDYIGDTRRIFYVEREILEDLDALDLSEKATKIASLFNGIDTVEEIIQKNDDFRLETLEAIIELYTKDLLLPV